jgi:hypothetical protein
MPAGKGRIILRSGFSLAVTYEYAASRRPGILEGCFSGKLVRLERCAFFDSMTLACEDGREIDLTVTTYSEKLASFTGTAPRHEIEAAEQHGARPRAVA